jgi:hypothetical protein
MNFFKFKYSFLILLLLAPIKIAFATDPVCSHNAQGEITDTVECKTQPDEHHVYFYKVAVCSDSPIAPSDQPYNIDNCKIIFQSSNPNGSEILVQKNIDNIPADGSIFSPPSGTYKFGVIEIAPVIKIKKTATFSRSMSAPKNATEITSGTTCWSNEKEEYNDGPPIYGLISCSNDSSSASPKLTSIRMNKLFNHNYPVYFLTDIPSSAGNSIGAYLIDNSGKLGTSTTGNMGSITRILGITPINLVVTDKTSQINILFNNSMGTTLSINSDGTHRDNIFDFNSGPFDFSFETLEAQ